MNLPDYIKKRFNRLNSRLNQYASLVDALYNQLIDDTARLAGMTDYDGLIPFDFQNYPGVKGAFDNLVNTYLGDLSYTIDRGTRAEWEFAQTEHDDFVRMVLNSFKADSASRTFQYLFNHQEKARDAFLKQRRDGKHGWSNRVWNLNDQVHEEMQLGISAAISDGTSADELSRTIRGYLNEPDKLFRRVRNEYGELVLSKNAAAYHPGAGVYRSSYKNAMRLARTEINMSYRNGDMERYQQEDFVVGYEIKLSHSHPKEDMCDELAGKYPKTFKWTGWHPQDLCYIVPILKTEEEFFELDEDEPSKNEVTDVPDQFKKYLEKNADRLEAARQRGTLPYWVKDNYSIGKNSMKPTTFEGDTIKIDAIQGSKGMNGSLRALARRNFTEDTEAEQLATAFSQEQIANHREVETALGIKQGARMTFMQADNGNANPKYSIIEDIMGINSPYNTNCTMAVVAHEMRMRGWDIEAKGMSSLNATARRMMNNGEQYNVWLKNNGNTAHARSIYARTREEAQSLFDDKTQDTGRYHVSVKWKEGQGHIFCVDRTPDGELRIYDPQSDRLNFKWLTKAVDLNKGIQVLRVDNLLIDPEKASKIVQRRKKD